MFKFLLIVVLVLSSFGTRMSYGDYPSGKLVGALALKESGNNDKAIGDKKEADHAYGHLQVRQPCVDDVNRKFGTHYKASDCLKNRGLSEWICREYINMYATVKYIGRIPTDEDKSRIWNGGPKGFKSSSTISYWNAVKKLLRKL